MIFQAGVDGCNCIFWKLFLLAVFFPLAYTGAWVYLITPLFTLMEIIKNKIKCSKFPDIVVVESFIDVLSMVESNPRKWLALDFKRELVSKLETISYCIEKHLYKKIYSRDINTDEWLRTTAKEIAFAIRSQKKWILMPQEDSREKFMLNISKKLLLFAQGNWADLEKLTPEKGQQTRLWLLHGSQFARTLLVSAIPFTALYLIQGTPLALEKEYLQYMVAGSVLWMILAFLVLLDPLSSEKIVVLISQLLLGVKKKD